MPATLKPSDAKSLPGFSRRTDELRSELRVTPPELIASRSGALYTHLGLGAGEFHLQLFEKAITGAFPDLKFYSALGDELSEFHQLLLLYYFATADGSPLSGKYVSFADLPGGRMYAQAFQGYSGNEVTKNFGENIKAFKIACTQANGQAVDIADGAYIFHVLPRISVQIVYWLGEDEFPPSCNILFDNAATHYVPIDACAIIGSNLAHRIIQSHPATQHL